jgi:hypothetical protein
MYLRFIPDKSFITCLVLFVPLLILAQLNDKALLPKTIKVLCFVQWFGYAMISAVHGKVNPIIAQTIVLSFVLILLLFVDSTVGLFDFYKRYNRWIFVMAVGGSISFFLVNFNGFKPFYFLPDRAEEGRMLYNYFLTFTNGDVSSDMRYAGFFDEPGSMAYWGLYALIINKLFIKEKWIEIPLILCLLLTFSMGFYIQILVYLLVFNISKRNFGKGLIVIALFAIVIYSLSLTKNTELDGVYNMTYGRLENMLANGSGSSLYVENRADATDVALREFQNNPLFGTENRELNLGNNVYEPLALYGIIGSLFILYPFLWLFVSAIKNKDVDLIKANFVILLGFTHRPFHNNLLYFFVLYSIIIMHIRLNSSKPRFVN